MKTWEQLALLLLLVGALLALIPGLVVVRRRRKPEERERLRRLGVHRQGRLGEALITDVRDDSIFYSYEIGGVAYTASQDVSALRDRLPAERDCLVGHANLKYESKNPANSILVCEEWSGIRQPVTPGRASD